jgi:hypothetical protein
VLGGGALTASILFGVLYERSGPAAAFSTGAALAGVAAVLLLLVPTRPDDSVNIDDSHAAHPRHQ